MKPLKLAITPGEPAGIGPDLLLSIAQKEWPAQLVAFADGDMLKQRAKRLNLAITLIRETNNGASCRFGVMISFSSPSTRKRTTKRFSKVSI